MLCKCRRKEREGEDATSAEPAEAYQCRVHELEMRTYALAAMEKQVSPSWTRLTSALPRPLLADNMVVESREGEAWTLAKRMRVAAEAHTRPKDVNTALSAFSLT